MSESSSIVAALDAHWGCEILEGRESYKCEVRGVIPKFTGKTPGGLTLIGTLGNWKFSGISAIPHMKWISSPVALQKAGSRAEDHQARSPPQRPSPYLEAARNRALRQAQHIRQVRIL